jgi:type II secretory pathway pseudopilin PulG
MITNDLQENKLSGFTLLELAGVVLIILVLALISFVALNGQRAKARDAKRISDIRQLRTALEFYYSDEGEYPVISQPLILGQASGSKLCSKAEGGFVTVDTVCKQETTYMSEVPSDPFPGKFYTYLGALDGYDLAFTTEKDSSLGTAGIYHAHSQVIDHASGNK